METITLNQNNGNINILVNQTINNNQPIYLNSIPNLAESIKQGGETPLAECVNESDVRDILNG
jgi:hypothetical protein